MPLTLPMPGENTFVLEQTGHLWLHSWVKSYLHLRAELESS